MNDPVLDKLCVYVTDITFLTSPFRPSVVGGVVVEESYTCRGIGGLWLSQGEGGQRIYITSLTEVYVST